ncbi:MAG TPA: TOBE domain-containing protein [Ottowia sp.]|uniref:TOBE domain-containing protein n=1 Tax=Ottowia sp. TaxID=1898956 RepID=UPI002C587FBC|nr:TOBE domain-containing protein [Ottowia sp.]HMN21584.1 TOBE domain-containing protein [Ottowia sp.]
MKTSARNQFQGTVTALKAGAVNDEVEIDIGQGVKIVAIVTHESAVALDLAVGRPAVALVKASSPIVVAGDGGLRFSARNQLSGTVSRVQAGAVNTEVEIEVAGGLHVVAIVTQESASRLGLAAGQPASALFKASSVIVGVLS